MIAYFLGIPGSGKTYYGVNVIYDNFAKDIPKKTKLSLKKDYKNCYTNINEFNFELTNNVFKFDFDEFYSKLEILYRMHMGLPLSDLENNVASESKEDNIIPVNKLDKRSLTMEQIKALRDNEPTKIEKSTKKEKLKKASDAELIEKAKELNIFKTLFVIDECHNFLDTQDKVKIWWLTYHRHLYHDIYFITQSLSLVNLKYKPLAEAFYKAKSNSLTLDKRYFNYIYFTELRMSKDSKVSTIKVRRNQDVFNLYKSGDTVKTKNVILRFIYIAVALFVLLIFIGFYFYYKQTSTIHQAKKNEHIHTVVSSIPANSSTIVSSSSSDSVSSSDDNDYSSKKMIIFYCSFSVCSSHSFSFPPQLLKKFIDMEKIHLFYTDKINRNLSVFYVSMSNDFYNFLNSNKVVNNDKSSFDASAVSLFGSK